MKRTKKQLLQMIAELLYLPGLEESVVETLYNIRILQKEALKLEAKKKEEDDNEHGD